MYSNIRSLLSFNPTPSKLLSGFQNGLLKSSNLSNSIFTSNRTSTSLNFNNISTSFAIRSFAKTKITVPKKIAPAKKETPKKDKVNESAKLKKKQEKEKKEKSAAKVLKQKQRERSLKEKEKVKQQGAREKDKVKEKKDKLDLSKEKEKERKQLEREKKDKLPKRPTSAYVAFIKKSHKKYSQEHPNDGAPAVLKGLSEKWKTLSDAEKKPFNEEAKKDKARFEKEKSVVAKNAPPKRPLTPFIIFSSEVRKSIIAEKPDVKVSEVAKKCGEKWRKLSDTEKEKYKKMGLKLKDEYARKLKKTTVQQ